MKTLNKKYRGESAAVAGGFVAGITASCAVDSMAQEFSATADAEAASEETIPEETEAIITNEEGIRVAHVDATSFSEAFAQARAQVGAGGVFEYNGRLYGTYLAEEWESMSPEERADYQHRVNGVPVTNQPAQAAAEQTTPTKPQQTIQAEGEDFVAPEPQDNEIKVLGVDVMDDGNGNQMTNVLIEQGGEQALLVDIDNDGIIDVLIHDDNANGVLEENEFHNICDANIAVNDLVELQHANEGNLLYASGDGLPDYVNDADSIGFA